MKRLLILLLIPGFLFFTHADAQNLKLKIEKEPSWITVNKINYDDDKLDGEAENGYVDLALDKQVSLKTGERYYKRSNKILSEAGVQNGSEVSVNFDPTYEQLIFHTIRIIRDGISINKLRLSDFKVVDQEKELDRHLYDGSLTAYLVLQDVRKGDIIEYSYTKKGFNPIFDGKYSDEFDCNYEVPVGNLFYKLVVPDGRNITIKNRNTNITAVITKEPGQTVYEWKATDIPALHLESKTPGWYDPYGSIMISEFQSWNEVSNWAAGLFPRNIPLSPALKEKIKSIMDASPDPDARTSAALRFVQDDIRYMGIEIGVNSHKPNSPNKIFVQRFGDCKDKSYLLVTMLNAMGIEADPVLINTYEKKSTTEYLPSGYAFDHCTVQARLNGKVYWFDPTISFQRGPIDKIAYPDYQVGLVVNPSTTALTPIPFHEPGSNDIKEVFKIYDMSGKAWLKVTTISTGSFADDRRYDFKNNSLYEIKNKYKDYYAAYFDKITADSVAYKSNDTTGAFTTEEYYRINDIWKNGKEKKELYLSPFVIDGLMNKPDDKNRTMPFTLTFPARYTEQVEVNLPEHWPLKGFDEDIKCANFVLHADGNSVENKVTMNYSYEALKDNVLPSEAANFFTKNDDANKAVDYELSYTAGQTFVDDDSRSDSSGLGLVYLVLTTCVVIIFFVRRSRNKNGFF
jgi:hypothetical protein